MENKVFFGESGLTTTSANHVANLAKERISVLEREIENLSFIDETVKLASSSEVSILNQGCKFDEINQISSKLNEIASYKCLIAWLREAIKAKEAIVDKISRMTDDAYCELIGTEMPQRPIRGHLLTTEEAIDALSIKERDRYFTVETIAAVYGKAIHPTGAYAKARKNAQVRLVKPHEVYGQGRDMTIYSYSPSVSIDEVDETFFKLQAIHREAQAELNGIKHKIDTQVVNQNIEVEQKFNDDLRDYHNKVQSIMAGKTAYLHEKLEEASKLKIVIPNALKATYDKVVALGK